MNRLLRRPALWLTLGVLLVVGVFLVVVTAGESPPAPRGAAAASGTDLGAEIREFVAGLHDDDPYRPPTAAEKRELVGLLRRLEPGSAAGFTLRTGVDQETGRRFALAVDAGDERAWGWYLVDLSAPLRLVIEVPHPNSDLRTEEVGLALYQAVPGSVLLMSGTHRRVEDGAGDVAHRTDSMFHAVAVDLAKRHLPQVQLHGFHDDSLPDDDVVVSPGAGDAGDLVRRVADELDEDFRICRAWRSDCGDLEGKTNVQGRDAADRGTPFAHVEISRSVRDDRASTLVRAMARAF